MRQNGSGLLPQEILHLFYVTVAAAYQDHLGRESKHKGEVLKVRILGYHGISALLSKVAYLAVGCTIQTERVHMLRVGKQVGQTPRQTWRQVVIEE